METLWFGRVAFMVTSYVVLDGFDIGVGIISHLVARTEDERRLVLRSIGPVWDGNEVWLIAAGSALFFAFPKLYAASFSGFYLPLMIVLWLLMLRGMGIELRSHIYNPLWRSFFDFVFTRSCVLIGAVSFVTLTVRGANYLLVKTEGDVHARGRRLAHSGWWALVVMTALSLGAAFYIRPQVRENFRLQAWGWLIPVAVTAALISMRYCYAKRRDVGAFLASALYIVGMLGGAAFALYPYLLPASTGDRKST